MAEEEERGKRGGKGEEHESRGGGWGGPQAANSPTPHARVPACRCEAVEKQRMRGEEEDAFESNGSDGRMGLCSMEWGKNWMWYLPIRDPMLQMCRSIARVCCTG